MTLPHLHQRETDELLSDKQRMLYSSRPEDINLVDIVVEKNVDEKWTDCGKVPTFTVTDARNMEWDYVNVVQEIRKNSLISEFGDLDQDMDDDLTVFLDPFYDVTTTRLKRMFRHFAPDGAEKVTYEAFHNGLMTLGISTPPDVPFEDFVRKIDTDQDGYISLEEFIRVIQMVKQAHLFRSEHEPASLASGAVFRVVDYSPTNIHAVTPVKNLESFMFSATPEWAKVRWVHVCGFNRSDDINLRRLAIKYQLHPLALEDCLNKDDVVRCKYEHYEDHTFLCLPIVRPLDKQKKTDLEGYISRHRYDMYAKDRSLGGRSMSEMSYEKLKRATKAVKRVELTAKLDNMRLLMRRPQQLCVFVVKGETVVSVQEDSSDDVASFALWHSVFKLHMTKSYSKIRNHDAWFLVISILNEVVDEIMPLVMVFETKLKMMGKLLRIERTKFNTKRFTRAKKNLIAIEKIVRPLFDLVEGQLIDQDEFKQGEVKNYLRDVRDHLKQMASDIKDHLQSLAELVEADKEIRAKHRDDVLYIMSISAALFLPGTFMTGLYGMNFDNMPELHAEYGYFIWWGVFLTILVGLFTYFKFFKEWI
ncbi:hypothetical protein AC1031_009465 [Aphanomyces cochlioides]|nr:hypothetical protein AC1031_009465 [Aphanomyces cochlioides]